MDAIYFGGTLGWRNEFVVVYDGNTFGNLYERGQIPLPIGKVGFDIMNAVAGGNEDDIGQFAEECPELYEGIPKR